MASMAMQVVALIDSATELSLFCLPVGPVAAAAVTVLALDLFHVVAVAVAVPATVAVLEALLQVWNVVELVLQLGIALVVAPLVADVAVPVRVLGSVYPIDSIDCFPVADIPVQAVIVATALESSAVLLFVAAPAAAAVAAVALAVVAAVAAVVVAVVAVVAGRLPLVVPTPSRGHLHVL